MATMKILLPCQKTHVLKKIIQIRQLHAPRDLRPDVTTGTKKRKPRNKAAAVPRFQNRKQATKVVDALKPYLDQEATVIECYPGKGILTKELLKQGLRNISCWEPEPEFSSDLEILQKSNEGLEVEKKSFFHGKGSPTDRNFDKLQKKPWESEPQVKVVGLLHPDTTSLWMSKNAYNMVSQTFPHSKGRVEFFLFISGREHQLMFGSDGATGAMNGPVPRRIYDYELFYTKSTLSKVPMDAFDRQINFGHIPKTAHWDQDHLYLVRVTPRSDLFSNVCSQADFPDFIVFTQQLFRVRRVRLIPRLEQWCPSLGLLAIDLGYSMMDTVKQLQARDLPVLFKELKAKGGMEALKEDVDHRDVVIRHPDKILDLDKQEPQETPMRQRTQFDENQMSESLTSQEHKEKLKDPNPSFVDGTKETTFSAGDTDLDVEYTPSPKLQGSVRPDSESLNTQSDISNIGESDLRGNVKFENRTDLFADKTLEQLIPEQITLEQQPSFSVSEEKPFEIKETSWDRQSVKEPSEEFVLSKNLQEPPSQNIQFHDESLIGGSQDQTHTVQSHGQQEHRPAENDSKQNGHEEMLKVETSGIEIEGIQMDETCDNEIEGTRKIVSNENNGGEKSISQDLVFSSTTTNSTDFRDTSREEANEVQKDQEEKKPAEAKKNSFWKRLFWGQ